MAKDRLRQKAESIKLQSPSGNYYKAQYVHMEVLKLLRAQHRWFKDLVKRSNYMTTSGMRSSLLSKLNERAR